MKNLKLKFTLFTILQLLSHYPFPVTPINPSLNDDVLGLIVFKSDIQDPNSHLTTWNEEDQTPCTNWTGIKCNPKTNRVTELNLSNFNLSGKLGRGLMQLHSLKKLTLSFNNLSGLLSLSLSQLYNLRELDLSDNNLSGAIPGEFFVQCGSLRSVNLSRNRFSGVVPDSLGKCGGLGMLDLSGNLLSGELPGSVWGLSGLRVFDVSGNVLEGEIGEGVRGMVNLREFRVGGNRFSGEVPGEIGECLLLREIDLSGNGFVGIVPKSFWELSLCGYLNLSGNGFSGDLDWIGGMGSLESVDLSGNKFTGGVPEGLGKVRGLKVLNLRRNGFVGSLPDGIEGCVSLVDFDVSFNSLTGGIPDWLFKLGLERVLVSDNEFSGSVDNVFGSSLEDSRKKVVVIDFSGNKLSGEIPSSVGDFSGLEMLSMARNEFFGSVPDKIGLLKSLSFLDLGENRLNNSIPVSIGDCAALTSLSLAHNELTGSIPASLAKASNLQTIDFSFNKLSGGLPKQLANLMHLQLFNVSHNQLQGELPSGSFFNTISPSSLTGNPSLCGAAVNTTCPTVLPKPIVLNPNSTDATPGPITPGFARGKKILSISALIAIGAAAAIVIGVIAITVLNLRVRASPYSGPAPALTFSGGDGFSQSQSSDGESGKLVMFSGDHDFSSETHALLNKDCELGRGGFGAVYRTVLRDGRSVAIKKLTISSLVKSQDDFEREVRKLGKVSHGNLVKLEGYYWTSSLQLLIYEFVSGGNLYKHLHEGSHLSWNERFNIILGAAKGLSHLHQMNVIHYNLKSSNILIDDLGEPKVADYGLAQLLPMLDRYVLSSKIQSALGYMAPEFACKTVKITDKCDVYGFGILVLEIVTGKRPVEYMEDDVVVLSDMVRGALEEGKVEECVDNRLQGKFPAEEAIPVIKLGLICTSQVPSNRPDMAEVVNILELIRCPSESPEDELESSS